MLLINILLAIVWTALTGEVSVSSFMVGFLISYALLYFTRNALGAQLYTIHVRRTVAFLAFFAWELLLANFRVARDTLIPYKYMRSGLLAIPLEAKTDAEITVLANLITLTPGTMTLEVSSDRKVMYIHDMYVFDVDSSREKIKTLERKMLGALR